MSHPSYMRQNNKNNNRVFLRTVRTGPCFTYPRCFRVGFPKHLHHPLSIYRENRVHSYLSSFFAILNLALARPSSPSSFGFREVTASSNEQYISFR